MSSITRPTPPGPEMQAALRDQVARNIERLKRIGSIKPNKLVRQYEEYLAISDVRKRATGPGDLLDLFA